MNGKGDTGSDGEEGDDARGDDNDILPDVGPEGDHGPGLVHEGELDDDDEEERHDIGGDAAGKLTLGNVRVVPSPEVVEVGKDGGPVEAQKEHADGADDEAQDVKDVGGPAELGRGGHDEKSDEHDDTGTKLSAIVDADAGDLAAECIEHGHGDLHLGLAVSKEEGDVLRVWVKAVHVVY